jgi:hypothetical protein
LRAVERLDVALLVDRDTTGRLGGSIYRPTMFSTFSTNLGSLSALKVRMRLQPMRLPQTLHGAQTDSDGFGHIMLKNSLASATRLDSVLSMNLGLSR